MNENQQKIESLLFYENQPLSYIRLSRYLGISVVNTKEEIANMLTHYEQGRGLQMIITDETVALVTHLKQQDLIASIKEQEKSKELSKQALETLAIILFKKQVTKAEIDYIRGVNSVYILRHLLIRGLVVKKVNPADKRAPLYIPSIDILAFLGVSRVEEIKNYLQYSEKLVKIINEAEQEIKTTVE